MKQKKSRMYLQMLLLALPGIIMFFVLVVFPFLSSARYSVLNNVLRKKFVGLENFKKVISNKYFGLAFTNSFRFAVIGILLLLVLSVLFAFAIHRIGEGTALLRILLVLPVLLPTAGIAMAWRACFKQMYYYELMKSQVWGDFWYILPIYLMYLWKNVGLCMLVLLTAMDRIPEELYDAAKMDGAGRWKCHFGITIPMLRPNLLIVILYAFLNSLKIYKESYLFFDSNNYPKNIAYTLQYYMNNHFMKLNYPTLSVASLLFTLVVGIFVAFIYHKENKWSAEIG